MALALFDLDNTLLAADSDYLWGQFLVDKGVVDGEVYAKANDQFYEDYKQGQLDIMAFLRFALRPLSQHSLEQLQSWHAEYMQECIHPNIAKDTPALLQKHRDQGDTLVIITATNRFITGPIADYLGVDDIIATEAEFKEGAYTGDVAGTPCFQDGKVTRLHAWLEDKNMSLEGSYFYSDSNNDVPLLEHVEHAFAVDPDDKLKALATERGWPVMSLR